VKGGIGSIRRFFGGPVGDDDYRAWLLHYLTNVTLVLMAINMLMTLPQGVMPRSHFGAALASAAMCLAARWAMHRGAVRAGGVLFVRQHHRSNAPHAGNLTDRVVSPSSGEVVCGILAQADAKPKYHSRSRVGLQLC